MRCWCGGAVEGIVCLESRFHDPFATGRPVRVTKLYIAGPMSGYPQSNYPAFNHAADLLDAAGYEVVNPAAIHLDEPHHYVDLLREDLREMLDCHGVATLETWWESTGARNEVQVAGILKMPVRPVDEWLW